jgi:hypothetical protein
VPALDYEDEDDDDEGEADTHVSFAED